MAERQSTSTMRRGEGFDPPVSSEERLPKWLVFSLILHGILIAALFLAPSWPTSSRQVPVYTVDLVGGEKIGRANFGTELTAPAKPPVKKFEPKPKPAPIEAKQAEKQKPPPEKAKPKPPDPKPRIVEEAKREEVKKEVKNQEKVKPAPPEPKPQVAKAVAPAAPKEKAKPPEPETKAAPAKSEISKEEAPQTKSDQDQVETASAESLRERLIQSAVERAKARTEKPQLSKGEALSAGSGEGEGAAAIGPGGRGGPGIVKGIDFIAYQNRMLATIKENWAWVGQRSNLSVVVHFGIRENGEIFGLKIIQPSGDPSYDESVLRAVKKSSPLPAPPEDYRRDFADVQLTFRPRDLGA